MAQTMAIKDKHGKITGYRIRVFLGRDKRNKRILVSKVIPKPEGLTPAKEKNEIKRQADAWEQEQKKLYQDQQEENRLQEAKDRSKISIPVFIEKYWFPRHVQNGDHTPKTEDFYKDMSDRIKSFFQTEKPKLKLVNISKIDILDFVDFMRKAKKKNGEPLSKTTIQLSYSCLRNILNYAVYLEFIPENPCNKIRREDKPKKERKEIDFLSEEQAITFLSCLDSEKEIEFWKHYHNRSNLQWKCIVNMLILTGLRRGELMGLQWRDLEENRSLHVRRNVTLDRTHKGDQNPESKIHIGELKGKDTRKVAVSQYLYDLLMEYKKEQETIYGGKFVPSAFIFCRATNLFLPMYPTEPTRILSKYVQRHSLPNVSPHDLRHTAATLAIESGEVNIKDIQNLLGHRDPQTTMLFYAAVSEKAAERSVNAIESMIRPKPKEEPKPEAEEKQA